MGLATTVALGIILGSLGAAFLAQYLSAPVQRLARDVAGIDSNSLDRRVETGGLDSELTRLATALNTTLDRLEAAFEQQRALVARASHSLRTPIATILSVAEVTSRRDRTPEEHRSALADIAHAASGAAVLIDQLLSLARADAARGALSIEPVDLHEVGADLSRLFRGRAEEAGARLEIELPAGLQLLVDRSRLMELLAALVDNAVRYTPKGGTIGVTARALGGSVELEVWDTGLGIAPEERALVFERFVRGTAAETSGQPGTGLGLSVARAIAEAHGAAIRAEARPGGGTRIILEWPPA